MGSEKDGDRIITMAGGRDMRIVRIEAVKAGEGTQAATKEVVLAVGGIRVMKTTGKWAGRGAGAETVAATSTEEGTSAGEDTTATRTIDIIHRERSLSTRTTKRRSNQRVTVDCCSSKTLSNIKISTTDRFSQPDLLFQKYSAFTLHSFIPIRYHLLYCYCLLFMHSFIHIIISCYSNSHHFYLLLFTSTLTIFIHIIIINLFTFAPHKKRSSVLDFTNFNPS